MESLRTSLPRNSFQNFVLTDLRLNRGDYEAAFEWYLTVACALHALKAEAIPPSWRYVPGPGDVANGQDPFDFFAMSPGEELLSSRPYDAGDLVFLGNVLVRYLRVLKDAGLDN